MVPPLHFQLISKVPFSSSSEDHEEKKYIVPTSFLFVFKSKKVILRKAIACYFPLINLKAEWPYIFQLSLDHSYQISLYANLTTIFISSSTR